MKTKSFWVIGSGALSQDDLSTLTLLYQPLIGTSAYGIYQSFYHFLDCKTYQSELYSIRFLMDMLNLKDKELKEAMDKLEAIGLLSTYLKEDLYLFRLSVPLSPRQFFLDGVLGSFLRSEIGDQNFKVLFDRYAFKEVRKEGYQNVTKSFDQVYQINSTSKLETNQFIIDRKNGKGVIINSDFDFDQLYKILPVRLQKKRLFTKRIQSQIASIKYVYGFEMNEMIDILSEAYDESHASLFYERIALYASKTYEKINQATIDIDLKTTEEKRPLLSSFTPQDIIQTYAPKMTNMSYALQTIRQFVERNAVDVGIINAVIIICLRIKEDLPNLNYLEKVLNTLLQKGITTEALAYEYLMKEDAPKRKTYKHKTERFVPEWMDEFEALLEEV
ncbi:MAG: DnaD domain protein [Acholeplasma sp.]|nr:DnaD domain protein [Acholeplasma sp.]